MYRCVSSKCSENTDYNFNGPHDLTSLFEREKEIVFNPRILLICGHSVCQQCLYITVARRREEFYKCDDCGQSTNFSRVTVDAIRRLPPKQPKKDIVPLDTDGVDDLQYEAYTIGAAFNSARISITATPIVDIDESQPEIPTISAHSYRDEPEVLSISTKISTGPENYKYLINDGINAYSQCSKTLKVLFEAKTNVNRQYINTKEAIRKRFQLLHGLLQLEETNLMRQLKKKREDYTRIIQSKEREIDSVRSNLKGYIMRSPQFVNITSNNPIKSGIIAGLQEPIKLDCSPEIRDELIHLNRPHDELLRAIKKLVDFNKAVNFELRLNFTPMYSEKQVASNQPSTSSGITRAPQLKTPLAHINFKKQLLVTIHDVKDTGYFSAHLPKNEVVETALRKALVKWCSLFRHPPNKSELNPGNDYVVYHSAKKEWCRAKFIRFCNSSAKLEGECFAIEEPHALSQSVEVELLDYNDEHYKLRLENLRESCSQLTDYTIYPKLLKTLKCRLKNVQPSSPAIRQHILIFTSGIKVKLLIQSSDKADDISDVDLVHDLPDTSNSPTTLIEYLIYSKVAKLRDNKITAPYPKAPIHIQFRDAPVLEAGRSLSVDVTYIRHPNSFYVTIAREREAIEKMEKSLNNFYEEHKVAYRLYCPRKWVPCAARYETFVDSNKRRGKMFHRAYIQELKGTEKSKANEHVTVYFVDYGEIAAVPVVDLRILPDSYIHLPKQAILCSLADISPSDSRDWGENARVAFRNFFAQASDVLTACTVKSVTTDQNNEKKANVVLTLHSLQHHHPDGNINEILVQESFAIRASDAINHRATLTQVNNINGPLSNGSQRRRQDFNGFNLLKDIVRKGRSMRLGEVDSLVPVKVTSFIDPSCFYIQIATPEVQAHILSYMKRMDDEFASIENARIQGKMQGFDIGEFCIWLYRADTRQSSSWRRGIVKGVHEIKNEDSARDPRAAKQVTADTVYQIQDRDFGVIETVQRRYMRQVPPASPYRKDGDMCVRCSLFGIEPVNETWTLQSIEIVESILKAHRNELHIKVDANISSNSAKNVPVDLIYRALETPNVLAPSEEHYYSIAANLLDRGVAVLNAEDISISKELIPDEDESYIERLIPYSVRDDSSLVSCLRESYFSTRAPPVNESKQYFPAKRPDGDKFLAICTEVEDGLKLWFTLVDRQTPGLGTIKKAILQEVIRKEKLSQFTGKAEIGQACTAYDSNKKTWYRAEIVNSEAGKLQIRYVDTGTLKDHYMEDLSSDVFCEEINKLALVGRLINAVPYNDRPETEARLKSYLKEKLIGKRLIITWENFGAKQNMVISVLLEESGRDLKKILLNQDLIKESNVYDDVVPPYIRASLELMGKSEFEFPQYNFLPDKDYPVIVADLVEENYVYLQLTFFDRPATSDEDAVNTLHSFYESEMRYMVANVNLYRSISDLQVGDPCCALWKDEWFRGIISQIVEPKRLYKVFYVDWGNSELVELKNIRELPENFGAKGPPIFGFFARLFKLKPARETCWNERLKRAMKNYADAACSDGINFVARFRSNQPPFNIELYKADSNQQRVEPFFKELIDDGYLELVNE